MNEVSKSKEVALMSNATADALFGPVLDSFYEDLGRLRSFADQIIEGLPRLSRKEGMAQASAGWALVTLEPETGYPDFTMPPIPGLFGVPYENKKGNN
jgi:hypothetical protein